MSGNAAFWRGLNAWRVCVKTVFTLKSTPYSRIHVTVLCNFPMNHMLFCMLVIRRRIAFICTLELIYWSLFFMSKENIKLIRIILHIEKNAEFAIHTLYINVNKMPNVCRYVCRLNSSIDHRNSLSKESELFLLY